MGHFRKEHSCNFIHQYLIVLLFLAATSIVLSGCFTETPTYTPEPLTQEPVKYTSEPTPVLSYTPHLVPPPYFTWLDPALPEALQTLISQQSEFKITPSKDQALMSFSSAGSELVGSWTYLVVAPFYSKLDNIQFIDLEAIWKLGSIDIPGYKQLLMSEETKIHLSQYWGEPFSEIILLTDPDEILDNTWLDVDSLAIIPFSQLVPSYKVISIDNQNPLLPAAEDTSYPLTFPIYLTISAPSSRYPIEVPDLVNFDISKLTSVALTGVTAMVRDTAVIMEEKGILYPANDIRDLLLAADITHINNEVPFVEDCPPPTSSQNTLSFCSSDSYLELLESIGTDIVELSGDHFGDHGPEAMLHTLELYKEHNLLVYGGGSNLQSGLDPVTIIHNGNRISFIGCNAKIYSGYATASETMPGASACDFEWMQEEIRRLSEEGYIVIATMQHEEIDSFFPIALQQYDFRQLSEAGASIVSGSQAHHPQGFEITGSKFIHYGLGNLFFDQWHLARYNPDLHINKDKSFLDFHYIYNGVYINTRLVPLQFVDNARPRVMTGDEADPFLDNVYEASKWNNRWIYLYPSYFFDYVENQ